MADQPGPADIDRYVAERKKRMAAKRRRNRELHERATSDMRRRKTFARLWIAYVRLARDVEERRRPITVSELCAAAEISEAAFHKNFTGKVSAAEAGGIEILMLAMVDRISEVVTREVRREIGLREEAGETVPAVERAAIVITRLVSHTIRYPHLFHVEGILPREVIYSLSDALTDAIIWNGPMTLQDRADVVAMSKYHATALIGIVRSSMGEKAALAKFRSRIIYVMASQVLPALMLQDDSAYLPILCEQLLDPVELDIGKAKGYNSIESAVDPARMVDALKHRLDR